LPLSTGIIITENGITMNMRANITDGIVTKSETIGEISGGKNVTVATSMWLFWHKAREHDPLVRSRRSCQHGKSL
jgi:hypothetical protein